ncbi:uncharacterized protein ACO6RY_07437 [Pungitius sinensis]
MKDLRPNATSTSDKVKEEVKEEVQEEVKEERTAAAAGGSVQPSNNIIKMTDGGPAASCDSLTPEDEHPGAAPMNWIDRTYRGPEWKKPPRFWWKPPTPPTPK